MRALPSAMVLVTVACVGCRAHVVIEAPPSSLAPTRDRAAAYEKLKPRQLVDPGYRWGSPDVHALQLADGTVVEDPIDLALVVSPDSATMQHAARARELDELGGMLHIGAITVMTVALGGMLAGNAMVFRGDDEGHLVSAASSGLGSIAGLVLLLPAMAQKEAATRERMVAFHAYDRDLRARLALARTNEELTARWHEDASPARASAPPPALIDPAD